MIKIIDLYLFIFIQILFFDVQLKDFSLKLHKYPDASITSLKLY